MTENSTYKNSLKEGGKRFLKGIKWPAMAIVGLSMAFSACSSDDLAPANPDDKDTPLGLKLEVSLSVPVASRSYTTDVGGSNSGTEEGKEIESRISTLNLYLCEATDSDPANDKLCQSFFGLSNVEYSKQDQSGNSYLVNKITFEVEPEYFASSVAGKKLNLYFVANATAPANFNPYTSTFTYSSADSDGLGLYGTTGKSVPLVNRSEASLDFTGKSKDDILNILKELGANATLNLNQGIDSKLEGTGIIELERAVARIDYKDRDRKEQANAGSKFDIDGFPVGEHIYPFGEETGLYLKIIMLKMINVAPKAYLFRHTASGNETSAGEDVKLFGKENGGGTEYNWIADCDWELKKNSNVFDIFDSNYFFTLPTYGEYDQWDFGQEDWTNMVSLTTSTENLDNYQDKTYHCWRYVSENTLPSKEKMIHGLSTGVIFKAMLCNSSGDPLTKRQILWDVQHSTPSPWKGKLELYDDPKGVWPLYYLKYKGDEKVLEKWPADKLNGPLSRINIEGPPEEPKEEDYPYKDSQPDDYVYCLNYFYWIRHNEVSLSTSVTDPMEFAIVRNNIYKLSIKKINNLPYSFAPTRPDEEGTPDPEPLEVNVRINPWWYYQIKLDW